MSATLSKPPSPQTDQDSSELPTAALLENKLPVEWMLSRRTAMFTLLLGLVYAFHCLKPLYHTDLWGHLSYGRWMATGGIPSMEPLMPLAKGMPWVDTAWLSQLAGYGIWQWLGLAGLQGAYALTVTTGAGLVLHMAYRHTKSMPFAIVGLALFLALDWFQLSVARPQLGALALFLVFVSRTTRGRPQTVDWFLLPALLAVWANVHGSFVMGLAWLGMMAFGRAVDVVRQTGTLTGLKHDRQWLSWLLIAELSAVAALLNPYGVSIYAEVFRVSANANLASLTEWMPLTLRMLPGQILIGTLVALVMLYAWTPRRVRTWEVLALVGLGLASLWSMRFVVWFAPVAAILATRNLSAIVRGRRIAWPQPSPVSGKWTVVTAGLIWIFFAYSPPGMRLLHGREPSLERALSNETPIRAVEWLRENPPKGQVFNIFEWGDYLQWAGPADMQIFVNSHAHLVPGEVWRHYLQVIERSNEWEETLERYGVNTIVLDTRYRSGLIQALKDDPAWKIGYQDNVSAVFVRRNPI